MTVKDMSERYGCSLKTARRYLRQMYHYESPLAAPRWAVDEWETSRERIPEGMKASVMLSKKTTGRVIVPRKRG